MLWVSRKRKLIFIRFINVVSISYGVAAGIEEPSENCQFVPGICEARLVRKDNPSILCTDDNDYVESTRRRVRVKLFSLRRKNATIN